ncbi:DUF2752 domain-containing protein [Streptomyces tsukubensis]|uniref:DUF2752 domain-containing protein n=1 Tax=Streptomyces tsukubensis TaxID=83656 RepID=UPI00268B761E
MNAEPESAAPHAPHTARLPDGTGRVSRQGPRAAAVRLLVPFAVLAAVAGAFAYVGTVDPHEPGHYPACPLLRLTGVYCPGCGGLRSAHDFAHGEFGAALGANALAVAGYALFAVGWAVWAISAARGRTPRFQPRPAVLRAAVVLMVVFTVVRNLPFGAWLHP